MILTSSRLQAIQSSYSRLELDSNRWLGEGAGGPGSGARLAAMVQSEVDRRLEEELEARGELERRERELLLLEKEREMEQLRLEHERELYRLKKRLSQGQAPSPDPRRGCGLQLHIPRYKTVASGSQAYVEYEVEVYQVQSGSCWRLYRRYRQFGELHLQLSQRYGVAVAALAFPSRRVFGSRLGHLF